jgi:dipeptidase E
MKLLLTSAGFTTDVITDKCVELVGKSVSSINVAVINEAYAMEHDDHTWLLDELHLLRDSFGGRLEFVNLRALDMSEIKERIGVADIIYVVGGHTDYLMSVFERTGFSELLPELLKDKVYVGSSAGSMVICNRISTDAYARIYGENDTFGVSSYLGIVNIAVKPHLNSPDWPNNRESVLKEISQTYQGTIYGLSDTSAVVVNGENLEVIGKDLVKIIDGAVV